MKQKLNKERPILFSAPMVRALLEGRKTQTRRPLKPQPEKDKAVQEFYSVRCPFGSVGDRLWVRETYKIVPAAVCQCGEGIRRKVSPSDPDSVAVYKCEWDRSPAGGPWIPSIFMPYWASRIKLTILEVNIQRLQDITELQAMEEGVKPLCCSESYRAAFRRTWDWLHKPYGLAGWDANPWVWAIEFKGVEDDGTIRATGN
ncbi:hypothetical protein JS73_12945 [Synergistes jonesii]|uniref:Morphogenetic protein n=1 Tax=Synergistes jonesii TaxID=2754 RepID=A0A073INR3_9BACT|nr:hypothetical protein EH55_13135 [Synergistes jonesii]OFB60230.1 hypothetical protein JS73_12945 [Synergistes jonesii]OFB60955.1 hypothetical protein JS79_12580 [Synergistes jonesii]OFB64599.1 hypothetical protein JS72_03885 [Synergistes jonesii]OFB66437.1 hypothetical protein JS78_12965 [Synergistes jonesii]